MLGEEPDMDFEGFEPKDFIICWKKDVDIENCPEEKMPVTKFFPGRK